jgi:hypothetical protein
MWGVVVELPLATTCQLISIASDRLATKAVLADTSHSSWNFLISIPPFSSTKPKTTILTTKMADEDEDLPNIQALSLEDDDEDVQENKEYMRTLSKLA